MESSKELHQAYSIERQWGTGHFKGAVSGLTLFVVLLFTSILSTCVWRPYHATPLDALTEFPGYLVNSDYYDKDSVRVLQQKAVAGGIVILYRWRTHESARTNTYCLAVTFVTPEGNGWRAQSSGLAGDENHRCSISETTGFIAEYTVGGNITGLTTVFGLSDRGDHVRVEWSDGTASSVPIKDGAFLESRSETLQVQRVQVLDAQGNILVSKEW